VRNFGHVIVSAMADGEPLACALEARARWVRLGRDADVPVTQEGTLIVARHEDELAVLEGLAAGDPARAVRMLTSVQVAQLAPIATEGVLGGAHATLDLRVDPRVAAGRIADWLHRRGVRFLWGVAACDVEPPSVTTTAGRVAAGCVVVCPGPDVMTLFPDAFAARAELTRCKLQMLRVRAPAGRRYGPALITGLSLRRYPSFSAQPASAEVEDRLQRERPELLAAEVHLIVTQRPSGDLIIGDTHEYGMAVSPFGDERLDELVLGEARALLGVDRLEVRERWHGVYPVAPGDPTLVVAPRPGVRVVSIVSGVGMTMALGVAPAVIDDLLASEGTGPREGVLA
jgi:FAD dependent oxidoreductase TIGR03364